MKNFARVETKFFLTAEQLLQLRPILEEHLRRDKYFREHIANVYYDTPHGDLIRRSLDHPDFREKVRLRSYEVPGEDSTVFLEVKRKVDGIVYKRRESLTLKEAKAFLRGEALEKDSQILREIRYAFDFYRLKPALYLRYLRDSYTGENQLRVTVDREICFRTENLALEAGLAGEPLFSEGESILEVKTPGSIPRWLLLTLENMGVYPTHYSKYGKIYEKNWQRILGTLTEEEKDHVEQYSVR